MYIDSPVWQLKKTCPNCGQGYLILCTCDECHKVIAVCEEEGATFGNPFNISLEAVSSTEPEVCPHCNTKGKIRLAKDYELIEIGLTTNEYE